MRSDSQENTREPRIFDRIQEAETLPPMQETLSSRVHGLPPRSRTQEVSHRTRSKPNEKNSIARNEEMHSTLRELPSHQALEMIARQASGKAPTR